MKKLYLILALLAVVIAGGVAWAASYYPIEDPVWGEVETGQTYYIRGWFVNGATLTNPRWLGTSDLSGEDTPNLRESSTAGEDYVFVFEDAGTTINVGDEELTGYYIKSNKTGKYLKVSDDAGALTDYDHYETSVVYVSDRAEASVWSVEQAGNWVVDEETGERYKTTNEEWKWFRTLSPYDGTVLYLNNNFHLNGDLVVRVSTYNNDCAYFEVLPAEEETDPYEIIISKLVELYNECSGLSYLAGDGPGCYPYEAVEEFYAAVEGANADDLLVNGATEEEMQAAYDRLLAAYKAMQGGAQPMTDGYYYLISARTEWNALDLDYGTRNAIFTKSSQLFWKPLTEETERNSAFIWKFSKLPNGRYTMQSFFSDEYVDRGAQSANVYTAAESDEEIEVGSLGNGQFYIKLYNYSQENGTHNELHCWHHSDGAANPVDGTPLCLWNEGQGSPTAWYIQNVPQEIIDELNETHDAELLAARLSSQLKQMADTINPKVHNAYERIVPDDAVDVRPTDVDGFSSNAAMSAEHGWSWGNDGGGYGALINDVVSDDFFHTTWLTVDGISNGGYIAWSEYDDDGVGYGEPVNYHQLTAHLTEPVTSFGIQFDARTNGTRATPSNLRVQVSNDGKEWKTVADEYDMYDAEPMTEIYAGPFDLDAPYEYVRFYCLKQRNNNEKFFCISEIHYWKGMILNPSCPAATIGSKIMDDLHNALVEASRAAATPTIENIDNMSAALENLKTAYAAFDAVYADPAPLRNAVARGETAVNGFVQSPGVIGSYLDDANTESLEAAVNKGKDLLSEGGYTKAQITDACNEIDNAIAALSAQVRMPEAGKWYQFQFGTEEQRAVNAEVPEHDCWGRIATIARRYYTSDGAGTTKYEDGINTNIVIEFYEGANDILLDFHSGDYYNTLYQGAGLYGVTEDEAAVNPDLSYFRFINVGDSAYVIQNKATGLYLPKLGMHGHIHLSPVPGLFKINPLGYDLVAVESFDLVTGASADNYIHFADFAVGFEVRGFTAHDLNSKSAIRVVEVEPDDDYVGSPQFTADIYERDGSFEVRTFPVSVESVEGAELYTVTGRFEDDGLNYVALENITSVPAGQPFLYQAEEEIVTFHFGNTITNVAGKASALQGVLVRDVQAKVGNATLQWQVETEEEPGYSYWSAIMPLTPSSQRGVPVSTGYLSVDGEDLGDLPVVAATDVCILLKGDIIANSIKSTDAAVKVTPKDIFTLSGARVGTTADIQNLRRGVYVINGRKVLVP